MFNNLKYRKLEILTNMKPLIHQTNEDSLKILGKGMVTIPKSWRTELGISPGDMVKAKKTGNKIIIELKESRAPYRVYSDCEIDEFLKEDTISKSLVNKTNKLLFQI